MVVAAVLEYFNALSNKRRDGSITEVEKWIQGVISLPVKPALEAILTKDPVGIRILISVSVVLSAIASFLITSYGGIFIVTVVLLVVVWLSALNEP